MEITNNVNRYQLTPQLNPTSTLPYEAPHPGEEFTDSGRTLEDVGVEKKLDPTSLKTDSPIDTGEHLYGWRGSKEHPGLSGWIMNLESDPDNPDYRVHISENLIGSNSVNPRLVTECQQISVPTDFCDLPSVLSVHSHRVMRTVDSWLPSSDIDNPALDLRYLISECITASDKKLGYSNALDKGGYLVRLVAERQSISRPDRFNKQRLLEWPIDEDTTPKLRDLVEGMRILRPKEFVPSGKPQNLRASYKREAPADHKMVFEMYKRGAKNKAQGRLITDPTYSDKGVSCLNSQKTRDLVENTWGEIRHPTLEDIINMILVVKDTHGDLSKATMWKMDLANAFGLMDVFPEHAKLCCNALEGNLTLMYTQGWFGWTGTPFAFDVPFSQEYVTVIAEEKKDTGRILENRDNAVTLSPTRLILLFLNPALATKTSAIVKLENLIARHGFQVDSSWAGGKTPRGSRVIRAATICTCLGLHFNNNVEVTTHIRGEDNDVADALSRNYATTEKGIIVDKYLEEIVKLRDPTLPLDRTMVEDSRVMFVSEVMIDRGPVPGIPREVQVFISEFECSVRPSTKKKYESLWHMWLEDCLGRKQDPFMRSWETKKKVNVLCSFLVKKRVSGFNHQRIPNLLAALKHHWTMGETQLDFLQDPLVGKTLMASERGPNKVSKASRKEQTGTSRVQALPWSFLRDGKPRTWSQILPNVADVAVFLASTLAFHLMLRVSEYTAKTVDGAKSNHALKGSDVLVAFRPLRGELDIRVSDAVSWVTSDDVEVVGITIILRSSKTFSVNDES
eukprot:gene21950-28420_t